MRYLDGELSPAERARVEAALGKSTELQREIAIFRALKADFQELGFPAGAYGGSVWDRVNQQVTRPIGWFLFLAGVGVWLGYGTYVFTVSPGDPWEKLATAAVAIGILLLLASVIWERYRELVHDPYRNIYR